MGETGVSVVSQAAYFLDFFQESVQNVGLFLKYNRHSDLSPD